MRDFAIVNNASESGLLGQGCTACVIGYTHPGIPFQLAVKISFNYGVITLDLRPGNDIEMGEFLRQLAPNPHVARFLHHFQDRPTPEILAAIRGNTHDLLFRDDPQTNSKIPRQTSFIVQRRYPASLGTFLNIKRTKNVLLKQDVFRILKELNSGFLYLWNHRIAHMDVQLHNIMIDENGHIVIIDFGCSLHLDENGSAHISANEHPTGNSVHRNPSVINSFPGVINFTKQASWELGVLFYEVVFGGEPFPNYPSERCYGTYPNVSVPDWNPTTEHEHQADYRLLAIISGLLRNEGTMSLEESFRRLDQLCYLDYDLEFQRKESQFFRFYHPASFNRQQFEDLAQTLKHIEFHVYGNEFSSHACARICNETGLDIRALCYYIVATYHGSKVLDVKKNPNKTHQIMDQFLQRICQTNYAPFTGFFMSFVGYCYPRLGIESPLDVLSIGESAQSMWSMSSIANLVGETNISERIRLLSPLAQQHFADAEFNLALCYYDTGVPQNLTRAVQLFSLSASQNYSGAQFYLGKCFEEGIGTQKDPQKAVEFIKMAAYNRYPDALYALGKRYETGCGVKQNIHKAIVQFQKALALKYEGADLALAEAYCILGVAYEEGTNSEAKNLEKAIECYSNATELNFEPAYLALARVRYLLGLAHELGDGVEVNPERALELITIAASTGYYKAQYNLGLRYETGNGAKKCLQDAYSWYSRACSSGNLEAIQGQGRVLLEIGLEHEREGNTEQAMHFYKTAFQEHQNSDAVYRLALCYRNPRKGVEKNYETALEFFSCAAKLGHPSAEFHVGLCYERGEGTVKCYTTAFEYFHRSALQGNQNAQFHTGMCYKRGRGVPRNLETAIEWFSKASKQGNEAATEQLQKFGVRLAYPITKKLRSLIK